MVISSKRVRVPKYVQYVEYIESTGTQYIDTGFNPNSNTRVVMDAQHMSINKGAEFYFGARDASLVNGFAIRAQTQTELFTEYGSKYTYPSTDATKRLTIDFNGATVKIGDVVVTHSAESFQCNYPLYLFALDNAGSAIEITTALRLFSCQIYDNGILIRDYWPCYDKDGVACLYDKVSRTYAHNAGTGEFIAGGAV